MTIAEAHRFISRSCESEVVDAINSSLIAVDAVEEDGTSLLMIAARHDAIDVLDLLLKRIEPEHIDAESNYGLTALHEACIAKNINAVRLLRSAGANPKRSGMDAVTFESIPSALDWAALNLSATDPLHQVITAG